jgi:hypothetical protein
MIILDSFFKATAKTDEGKLNKRASRLAPPALQSGKYPER